MTNCDKAAPRGYRSRTATISLYSGMIAVVCILQAPNSITSVEAPVVRDCAALANETLDWETLDPETLDSETLDPEMLDSASPARDEAFIECIVSRDPSVTPDELRHKLETGDGDGLFNRLMTGEDLPITPESDCPYLRVAVQSPVGANEVDQKPMRDLFSTALTGAGFNVVDAATMHHWWASSLTLDTGVNSAAWTILVRAVPEIGDGAIQFTSVRKTVDGREGSFSGMQSLRAFSKTEAPEAARLAAERIAKELLPAAHRRCGDIGATIEQTRMRLEQLRNELTEEIERVRREKDEWEKASPMKQLMIEVEG